MWYSRRLGIRNQGRPREAIYRAAMPVPDSCRIACGSPLYSRRGSIREDDGSLQHGTRSCLGSRREDSMCSTCVSISSGLLAGVLAISVGWSAAFATRAIASEYGSNQQQKFDTNSKVVCWHPHFCGKYLISMGIAIPPFLLRVDHANVNARP